MHPVPTGRTPSRPRHPDPACWLAAALAAGPRPVMELRQDGIAAGIPVPALYAGAARADIVVLEVGGRKWWRLPDAPTTRRCVLLAEDDPGVRTLLTRVLRSDGLDVTEAEDGDEAVRLAAARGAELALAVLDVKMPRRGGAEALAEIRRGCPGLPCLFVTGDGDARDDRLLSAGAADVLHKPFRPGEFLAAVRGLLAPAPAGPAGV